MLQKTHSLSTGNIPTTNNRLYSEQNKKPVSNCAFVLGELELILYSFLCKSGNFLQCKKIGSIQQNKQHFNMQWNISNAQIYLLHNSLGM